MEEDGELLDVGILNNEELVMNDETNEEINAKNVVNERVEEESNDGDCDEDVIVKDKKRSRKTSTTRSETWEHYDKFICSVDKIQKAKCKYCGSIIKADPIKHGTTPLKKHFLICKSKPLAVAKNQPRVAFKQSFDENNKEGQLVSWKFDQAKVREAVRYMILVDELPLKTDEKIGFKYLMSIACPMFKMPSRRAITRDIFEFYCDEKKRLKSFIKNQSDRICITTDTWTSIQRINYICLTAHFIDDEWKLQKRILNFCPISGEDFDVLKWWKINSLRFPILSKIARDVFAVPVSTVSSESTFSTGGRVLDAFRSSLSTKLVQAIICAQNWLRSNNAPINEEEDLGELEILEGEFINLGMDSTIVDV